MMDTLREDLRRFGPTPRHRLRALLSSPGAWAVVSYRFRRWVNATPRPLRWVLKIPAFFVQVFVEMATNIQLPATASIGPGLFIAHTGYIVLSPEVVMGRHCTLTQGVTLGHAGGGRNSKGACPVLGNRVYVGPGAAIIGPVSVGDDALIGVGAVVTKPIPPRGVVAGNPARLLSMNGSFELIVYPGMDQDAERLEALAEMHPADASPAVP